MTVDELAPPSPAESGDVERAPQTPQSSAPKQENPGPPLRALAMVLISVGIVFAFFGALDFAGTDSAAVNDAVVEAPVPPAANELADAAPAPPTPAQIKAVNVRVLNSSGVAGLAGRTAKQLTGENWKVVETGNFGGTAPERTVAYYGTSEAEKQAALEIAEELGVAAEKKTPATSALGNGVVVVLVD